MNLNLGPMQQSANWEKREKQGRRLISIVSLKNSITFIAFELHYFPSATEPSERGGRQERLTGQLVEAGRTTGRSDAKDCAYEVIVVRWLLETLAQLRPAAAGLRRSDRPLRER
jgi:hypothetical protein